MYSRMSRAILLFSFMLVSISLTQGADGNVGQNLIPYHGIVNDQRGAPLSSSVVTITFTIYQQQNGGRPIWTETQSVNTDAVGTYKAELGRTTAMGVPLSPFLENDQLWLGVQVQGEAQELRQPLLDTPHELPTYTDESADCSLDPDQPSVSTPDFPRAPAGLIDRRGGAIEWPPILGQGIPNYIARWTGQNQLQSSVLYQDPNNGNIGVGTVTPMEALDVKGSIDLKASYEMGYYIRGSRVLSIGAPNGQNLFAGVDAGKRNAQQVPGRGSKNTFVGFRAGCANTSGSYNSFYGAFAGGSNTKGSYNVFYGFDAGAMNTTGSRNVFYGSYAGVSNTEGSNNTFYGSFAGSNNITGSRNLFLGLSAGATNKKGSYNIYIGNTGPQVEEDRTIRIGSEAQFATYIAGIYSSTLSTGVPLLINEDGKLGVMKSSLRFKERVRDMGDSSNGLMKLRPVTFFYKPEYDKGERSLQYGLIAEEVATIYPELVSYDHNGRADSVRYQYLASMLLNEVQKQHRRAEAEAGNVHMQGRQLESAELQAQQQAHQLERLQAKLSNLQGRLLIYGMLDTWQEIYPWNTMKVELLKAPSVSLHSTLAFNLRSDASSSFWAHNSAGDEINNSRSLPAGSRAGERGAIVTGEGDPNFIARWMTKDSLESSALYQDPTNNYIGIGNTSPTEALDVTGSVNVSESYGGQRQPDLDRSPRRSDATFRNRSRQQEYIW